MTTRLPERLRALADEAPSALDGAALWHAGRRRRRARAMTALVVAGAVVLIVALAGYGDWRSRRPDPAAPPATDSGPMSIPDRFYEPSPWLPTTSAPGRLVAVIPDVSQHHVVGGPTTGVVGVAAGSQRYTFLDLPGRVPATEVALAPDGAHLAYFIEGSTTKDRDEGQAGGFAVADLRTGVVRGHPLVTEHGINAAGFVWADGSTLLVDVNWDVDVRPHRSQGKRVVYAVEADSPVIESLGRRPPSLVGNTVAVPDGLAIASDRTIEFVDAATGSVTEELRLSEDLSWGGAMDRDRRHLAALAGDSEPGPLAAGSSLDGRVDLRRVPGKSRYASVAAVLDGQHALAVRIPAGRDPMSLVSVDVTTGRARVLSVLPSEDVQLAGDAVVRPHVVPAIAPAHPWNLRNLAIGALAGLVTIGALVWFDRGRRRARR